VPASGNPPPRKQLKTLMWVRGVVCRSTVACVILQCVPCFYECICMSDGMFIQFVCQVFYLMVCQRFICIVFVNSPHNSNEDHVELDFPISLSI